MSEMCFWFKRTPSGSKDEKNNARDEKVMI